MVIWRNVDNVQRIVTQPYIKVAGTWEAAEEVFTKVDGIWKQVYSNDDFDPPDPPQIVADISARSEYINIGVKMTALTHDPDIKMIKLKVKTGSYPAGPLGTDGYYPQATVVNGNDPFSDVYYNYPFTALDGSTVVPNRQTTAYAYRKFAPTWFAGKLLPLNTTYYIRAWAQNKYGLWSLPVTTSVTTAKYRSSANQKPVRMVTILPERVGTWRWSTGVFIEGDAISAGSEYIACFDYGTRIRDSIPDNVTDFSAYTRISRKANGASPLDSYGATSRVAGFFSNNFSTNGYTANAIGTATLFNSGSNGKTSALAKGATINFIPPNTWDPYYRAAYRALNLHARGLGSAYYFRLKSQSDDPNQGAITLRWVDP